MARRVYKWPLELVTEIPWSRGDRVLLVAEQNDSGKPTLWAEQEDENPPERQRRFLVVGTGQEVPSHAQHVGSAICGPYVWHVYTDEESC